MTLYWLFLMAIGGLWVFGDVHPRNSPAIMNVVYRKHLISQIQMCEVWYSNIIFLYIIRPLLKWELREMRQQFRKNKTKFNV